MRTWTAMALVAMLAGCGGSGGGDGPPNPQPDPAPAAPVITEEPSDSGAAEGGAAAFTVAWSGEVTSVRWQRDGSDLTNGAVAGATVFGATEATMTVDGLPESWSGSTFRAVLTGPGGTVTSRAATLTVNWTSRVVFFSDFEEAEVRPELDLGAAPAARDGVQGYAGYGAGDEVFAGQFLRSPTANLVTLTLAALPEHASLELDLLFAAIDSLDGTGTFPSGDFFVVAVDGVEVFRQSFANATDDQVQSYAPPPFVELARKLDLGFQSGFYMRDSAYDLGADPAFSGIPHTASSATITFLVEGPGIQPLTDESWAMDRLRVTLRR